MFYDRREAGKLLAAKLKHYRNMPGVILAVPRGGVPLGYEIAKELNLPLELILVKKIGHPLNKELAIGAVGLEDSLIVPRRDVSGVYIKLQTQAIRERLKEMKAKFMGQHEPIRLENKILIVVDDGIATGNTLLATITILKKQRPARIIVAAPVVSISAAKKVKAEVDELVSLLIPENFYGVGAFYIDFHQVSDEEVMECLDSMNHRQLV